MKIFTTIAAALTLSVLSTAHADVGDLRSVEVRYGDLDLSRPDDSAVLYRRVLIAAQTVCRDFEFESADPAKARLHALHMACIDQAIAGAVARIARPTFTAYVASKGPHNS